MLKVFHSYDVRRDRYDACASPLPGMHVYLIPGLGADRRLFNNLELVGHQVEYLDLPVMPEESTLTDYAKHLSNKVDKALPHALVGVSMGGMVAQELALLMDPTQTILISSWKGPQEMPPVIRALRGTHPERILTPVVLRRMLPLVRWQMGLSSAADIALFDAFIADTTLDQLKVQIAAVLAWEGTSQPGKHVVHIHGDSDRLMPLEHIANPVVVSDGGHFMVFNKGEAVSKLVLDALVDV